MAAGTRSVRLNDRAVDRLIHDPDGPVGQYLSRLGGFVTRAAQELADTRLTSSPTARFRDGRVSGRYRSQFRTTTVREAQGLRLRIINESEIATYLERGTRPHLILPRNAKVLAWQPASGVGGTIFAKRVHHPGTRAYRIMEDALRIGLARAL